MHSYLSWMADHLLVGVDVRSPEIDKNVYDKHNVHYEVHHIERTAGITTLTSPLLLQVIEQEGCTVGCENSSVDD